ncbi:NAD(P)-dependent dehydrogenase (short-subunit alcohol dehydrogenase family) [Leifsonia sp. EB41]|uniref:SDR family oxidoreductase n=1 Tax=Leifsonia sp. EB41 TaxID=3156260 RepID=UPI003519142C
MDEIRIALISGANKGIGYAIAEALGAEGWIVGVGARDRERGRDAVSRLQSDGANAFDVELDVTDDASVAAAATLIEERFGRLDSLINNAGAAGRWPDTPSVLTPDDVRQVFDTNVVGLVRVTNAMLPLLGRSAHPRIVNQSSHVGSLTLQASGQDLGPLSGAYAPSKTTIAALTIQYAKELGHAGFLVNASCPGYVRTDLNNFTGTATPRQGAVAAVRLASLPDEGPNGRLFDADGPVPW